MQEFTHDAMLEKNQLIRTESQNICPACGGRGNIFRPDVEDYFFCSPGSWSINKCINGCATLWLDPAPLPSDIGKAYENYHTHLVSAGRSSAEIQRKIHEKFLNLYFYFMPVWRKLISERRSYRFMFLKSLPKGRLLDVGCGGGRFLRRMQKVGWEVEGVDFDAKAAERVGKKYRIKTHIGDIRSLNLPHSSYDAIVMSHSIEHVFDPASLLLECKKLLKNGGRLVVITPNASSAAHRRFGKYWRGLEVPRHIQVFSRIGLDVCLARAGFNNRNVKTFSHQADGIYRVSEEMRRSRMNLPYDSFLAALKSRIYMLAEYKNSNNKKDSGEDILAIAIKD